MSEFTTREVKYLATRFQDEAKFDRWLKRVEVEAQCEALDSIARQQKQLAKIWAKRAVSPRDDFEFIHCVKLSYAAALTANLIRDEIDALLEGVE